MGARWLCRCRVHREREVAWLGVHGYYACRRCGRRRVSHTNPLRPGHLFGPWDHGWLATGEWTPMGPPPRGR